VENGRGVIVNKLFNENMTSSEARKMFYKTCENKTKEERSEISKEYYPIAEAIYRKEAKLAEQGYLCGGE
jgi:hypothetical protein